MLVLRLSVFFLSCCFNPSSSSLSSVSSSIRRVSRGMSEALERAVERTKEWQSTDRDRRNGAPAFTQSALRANANRPIRLAEIDVPRLNRLIKVVDRAWTLPKLGADEPIGSNFQYKKTCASIYKARCYSSAICDGALLNSTLLPKATHDNVGPRTLLRGRKQRKESRQRMFSRGTTAKHGGREKYERVQQMGGQPEEEEETTTKQVPFWQRLMVRKRMEEKGRTGGKKKEQNWENNGREGEYNVEEEEEEEGREEEDKWSAEEEQRQRYGTTRARGTKAKRTDTTPNWEERSLEGIQFSHTLHQLTPEHTEQLLQMERPAEQSHRATKPNIGFWRNFQPGKWFQPVHYMTNTGR